MFFIVNYHTSEFCHSSKKKFSGILRLDACNNVCTVFRMLLGFWMERMALQRYCEILTSVCWLRIPWIILWNWKNLLESNWVTLWTQNVSVNYDCSECNVRVILNHNCSESKPGFGYLVMAYIHEIRCLLSLNKQKHSKYPSKYSE